MPEDYTVTESISSAIAAERGRVDGMIAVLEQRLRGIDKANDLLDENMNRVPTEVQKEVEHLRQVTEERLKSLQDLMVEKFESVGTQFRERDTRSEREARDNKIAVDAAFAANRVAVDAAFAAQKEAASERDKSNQKAIDRSEAGTSDTIKANQAATSKAIDTLSDLRQATTEAVLQQMSDMKDRVARLENLITGLSSAKQGGQENRSATMGLLGLLVAVVGVFMAMTAAGVFK